MPVVGGKFAVIDGVPAVRQWSINDAQTLPTYVHSGTYFGTGRLPGPESWSGSFQFVGRQPPVLPGDFFNFSGFTSPDDSIDGVGMVYSGNALVTQAQMDWNWATGEVIGGQVDFAGNLALTPTAAGAQIFDDACLDADSPVGTKITYDAATPWETFVELTNLAQAQLTMTCQANAYVNSSTASGGRLWTGQRAGPVDWTLSITQQDVTRTPFTKGQRVALRIYVDADDYWELFWGRVQDFTGITADRSTGAIIQQTINIGMDGFDETADPCYGHVLMPDGTHWWPTAESGATTTTPTTTA